MRDWTNNVLFVAALALAGLAWYRGGWPLVFEGLLVGAKVLWGVLPLLVFAFLVAGLVQALVRERSVRRWLGAESGWRGIALACMAGALMPGGPYAYYPVAAVLLKSGAGLGVLVAFITAKNLWSITRLPLEFALLGPYLTIIRFLMTLFIPPLVGVLAQLLFGDKIEGIREHAP